MALEESKKEGPDSGKLKKRKQVKHEASDHEQAFKSASRLHHRIINVNWQSNPVFHCSVSKDAAEQMQNSCIVFAHVLWLTGTQLSVLFFSCRRNYCMQKKGFFSLSL